jgi:hypothetical protein
MPDESYAIGRYNPPGGPSVDGFESLTRDGATIIAEGQTRFEQPSSMGYGWQTMATSAVAALVVRPSTVAALELWNGSLTASLIIDRLFSQNLVSTAVNSAAGLWAQVTSTKAAPSTASLAVTGNYGKGYPGLVIPAVGTTVVANGWYPYGPEYIASNAAAPGGSWEALVEGRLIVPPQCSLCVHVVGSIVGDTYCSGASWFEKVIALA